MDLAPKEQPAVLNNCIMLQVTRPRDAMPWQMTEEMPAGAPAGSSLLQHGHDLFFPCGCSAGTRREFQTWKTSDEEPSLFPSSSHGEAAGQEEVTAEAGCGDRLSPPLEVLHHPTACLRPSVTWGRQCAGSRRRFPLLPLEGGKRRDGGRGQLGL